MAQGMAAEANVSREIDGIIRWSGMLTDAVVKCGRDSERRLNMYGISSTRCRKCHARLRPGIAACTTCHHEHKNLRKCMRCSQKNTPVMWCVECDAYFCAHCHKKPHVLMLGSFRPHHCFAIDSASGKHLVEAAWSEKFFTMVQATYQVRLDEKSHIDEAKAKSTEQLIAANVAIVDSAAEPEADKSSTSDALVTFTDVVESVEASSTVPEAGSPSSKPLRKRQLPKSDDGRDKKSARAVESSRSSGNSTVSTMDSMSLYDRVKAMHDVRAEAAQAKVSNAQLPLSKSLLYQTEKHVQPKQTVQTMREGDSLLQQQKEQDRQQEVMQSELSEKEQEQDENKKMEQQPSEVRLQQNRDRQMIQQQQQDDKRQQIDERQQGERRQQEEQHRHEELHRQEELHRPKPIRELDAGRQAAAQSSNFNRSSYVSQAKQILHFQPEFATASMAQSNIPDPVLPPTISPLATQSVSFQSTSHANVSTSIGSENGFQMYQKQSDMQMASARGSVPVLKFGTLSQNKTENYHLVVRNPNAQQPPLPKSFVSNQIVLHCTTGDKRISPSRAGETDEFRAIWVSDYDAVNSLVLQLDVEIMKRTKEGHEFVHRSNNITIPEQLRVQINSLFAQRDAAIKKRLESVVRVLVFSKAVRAFAQQNEHDDIWSDVPAVLNSSHKKCAELATAIRELERQVQKLRQDIDEAVSSGNPVQMQNVGRLGALITELERKLHALNGERDKQFIFMFQFSDTLRQIVRNEWAASESGYHLSIK